MDEATSAMEAYARELDDCQHEAGRAARADEAAHAEHDQATATLSLLRAGASPIGLAALRTGRAGIAGEDEAAVARGRQHQAEAIEDENLAVRQWEAAKDRLDNAARAAGSQLVAIAVGRSGSGGISRHIVNASFGGGRLPVFALPSDGTDGRAVPPQVENATLRDILASIYADPDTYGSVVGDGKVSTALLHELETGQRINRPSQW